MQISKIPIFSVIIPTYNREKLLPRAIDSVLQQTWTDFELIIVDDGSTDCTKKVVASYEDRRICYLYKENGGQNSALNAGIAVARGEYLAFLDSDDMWLPNKLKEVYVKFCSDSEISVVYHVTGSIEKGKLLPVNNDYLEGYIFSKVLQQEFLSSQISLACKKKCLKEIGGYDEEFAIYQDDDICFMLSKNYKVGLIKEIYSVIGSEAANRVTENNVRIATDYMRLIEKYKDDIIDNCGYQKLADMYYKASEKFVKVHQIKEARAMYQLITQYDIEGQYKKNAFRWNLVKCGIISRFQKLKSKLWCILVGSYK